MLVVTSSRTSGSPGTGGSRRESTPPRWRITCTSMPGGRKPLAAGVFQPEISSFQLALCAEGKAAKTVRNYTEAVQWFAAAHLIPRTFRTRWEQVTGPEIQRWMVWLLGRYSSSYASNQYRALQQFFKW
jgi:hypothetical protein